MSPSFRVHRVPSIKSPSVPLFQRGKQGDLGVCLSRSNLTFSLILYPSAYSLLTTIFLTLKKSGEGRIRTSEGFANRFTVCPLWPLGYLSTFNSKNISHRRESNPRPEVYKTPALPLSYGGIIVLLSQP